MRALGPLIAHVLWSAKPSQKHAGPPTGGNTRDKVTGPPSLGGPQGAPKRFRRGPAGALQELLWGPFSGLELMRILKNPISRLRIFCFEYDCNYASLNFGFV